MTLGGLALLLRAVNNPIGSVACDYVSVRDTQTICQLLQDHLQLKALSLGLSEKQSCSFA